MESENLKQADAMNPQEHKATGLNNIDGSIHPHSVHIPVMGTGFTVDTPLRVAKYGISSVVSIGDDILLEQMREYHSGQNGVAYQQIEETEPDYRARRITAYLNLVDDLVKKQFAELQKSAFQPGSEITRYFSLLPDSVLKMAYERMCREKDADEKQQMQQILRDAISPGSIDVNIMTKVDGDRYKNGEKLPREEAVAMSALRGYAMSRLSSSIVLSAGMNPGLFTYISTFDDFMPDKSGHLKKKVVLKVSDYRSAMIQGRLLAKKGVWVSEFRIESGLNCGGHAFASKGHLTGPILHEFNTNRQALKDKLFEMWGKALGLTASDDRDNEYPICITYQGGIGTFEEDTFIRKFYNLDGTGWGTPFLLVPEVTNVDDDHLKRLIKAGESDVALSNHSPLGVPFWSLQTSSSEDNRKKLIDAGMPGSSCPKGYLASNTEFTKVPICRASRVYQHKKLKQLNKDDSQSELLPVIKENVLEKSCLCVDLAAGALKKNDIADNVHSAVCCGPNIVNFNRKATLEEMMDHIYGRFCLISSLDRMHLFIAELLMYIDYLKTEYEEYIQGLSERTEKYFNEFTKNLSDGVEYYRNMASEVGKKKKDQFLTDLEAASTRLSNMINGVTAKISVP